MPLYFAFIRRTAQTFVELAIHVSIFVALPVVRTQKLLFSSQVGESALFQAAKLGHIDRTHRSREFLDGQDG